VARKVARSTEDAAQKISQKGKDLSLLEVTAKRVADSTSDAMEKLKHTHEAEEREELGDLRSTMERATSPMADRDEEQNLLGVAELTAERVARSTGIAVEKLVNASKEEESGSLEPAADLELAQETDLDLVLESDLESDLELALNPQISPEPTSFGRISGTQVLEPDLEPAAPEITQKPVEQGLKPAFEKGMDLDEKHAEYDSRTHPLPLTQKTLRTLPQPISVTVRTLPSPPQQHPPVSIGDNCTVTPNIARTPASPCQQHTTRTLPPIPQTLPQSNNGRIVPFLSQDSPKQSNRRKLPTVARAAGVVPTSLTNGYHHNPLTSPHGDLQHGTQYWPRSIDSDSEYSTTESVELTVQLLAPAYKLQVGTGDADLKTNPMKRMTHTAEMVAESTGKAVHKLTSTLA
jgi:hypothetical protein